MLAGYLSCCTQDEQQAGNLKECLRRWVKSSTEASPYNPEGKWERTLRAWGTVNGALWQTALRRAWNWSST
jgi:hypothetical protein